MNNQRSDSTVPPLTLAIAATFTAQAIEDPLAFWIDELDLPARVVFAPYNQLFQELLDPSSLLSTNPHGINIILIRLEDWQTGEPARERVNGSASEWRLDIQHKVSDFVAAMTAAAQRSAVPSLVLLCPVSPLAAADRERSRFFDQMDDLLVSGLAQVLGVNVITSSELMTAYPVRTFYNAESDKIAHVPYTPLCMMALATMIARRVYGLTQGDYKAVIVDCDDTLWTGICGEDGPLGVEIDSARQAIQDFLVGLHEAGALVCLNSRNNEADVRAVFDSRSEMRLTLAHVVASRFNWKPKSENISALAGELHLAPDAFVFLDDDPVQCAEVQANCPEVLTIQLPSDPEQVPTFLRNLWIFQGSKTTEEARRRTALYKQNVARERVLQDAPSLTDFLARLELKVQMTELAPRHLARASELTRRTNQFNLTTIRRSEGEIEALRQQGSDCIVVHAKDRFGDYGLVGLMIFSAAADALTIETFLLSCRALGRGVEHRMLAKLGDIATQRGLTTVDVAFVWSGKNQPAFEFLKEVAAAFEGPDSVFRIPAQDAVQVRYRPREYRQQDQGGVVERGLVSSASVATSGRARAKAALLASIARDLTDPEQIQAEIAARTRTRPQLTREYVAARTPAEQTIADILGQVLGIDRVGVEDNFFELGGHSLLAMQVLFRIREAFQVDMSARLLYNSAFTAADLAAKVVQLQLRAADAPQLAGCWRD